jgi:hypothetical protein
VLEFSCTVESVKQGEDECSVSILLSFRCLQARQEVLLSQATLTLVTLCVCRYKVRYYVNRGLALFNESLRVVGFQGLICNDPTGEVRKVYPLPFIFAKDLGEQHTVAGVMQHHCATYVVPREAYADLRATRDPGYPARTVKYMQAKRREIRKMPKKEATAEASRTGVYPRLKASAILCPFPKPSFRHLFTLSQWFRRGTKTVSRGWQRYIAESCKTEEKV